MARRLVFAVLLGGILSLFDVSPAAAQWENIDTVEGPNGENMTLTVRPRSVAEGLSVRALGISFPNENQWALGIIGAAPDDSIGLSYGGESLPIERIERPDDGVGPVRVYVSQETFLTMAEGTASIQVGDVTASFPSALRREMQKIFDTVT